MKKKFQQIYSTGIREIDEQHKLLFDAMNGLRLSNENTHWDLVMAIETYALTHFEAEEKYMQEYNYPFYWSHKDKHSEFLKKYRILKSLYTNEELSNNFVSKLSSFVESWILDHYQEEDMCLVEFLKKLKKFS